MATPKGDIPTNPEPPQEAPKVAQEPVIPPEVKMRAPAAPNSTPAYAYKPGVLPTVGRIVLFFPSESDRDVNKGSFDPAPAIITRLREDISPDCVDLTIFAQDGITYKKHIHQSEDGQHAWDWIKVK